MLCGADAVRCAAEMCDYVMCDGDGLWNMECEGCIER